MPKPDLARMPDYAAAYINTIKGEDILKILSDQRKKIENFLGKLPKEKRMHRYAEGKWTVKEALQHIIDAERVFAYRALCFARNDQNSLPGFDENTYAAGSKANARKWKDLVNDFSTTRRATEALYSSFDKEQLESGGTANQKPAYVLGLGFMIAGHAQHHLNIIKERYLAPVKAEEVKE
jgi:uncharacterized damage-inducible protein DinB